MDHVHLSATMEASVAIWHSVINMPLSCQIVTYETIQCLFPFRIAMHWTDVGNTM